MAATKGEGTRIRIEVRKRMSSKKDAWIRTFDILLIKTFFTWLMLLC
jgi:hypothetical protein